MKKLLTMILALGLMMTMAFPVLATEVEDTTENFCGEDMTWEYLDGTLTITGSGQMDDFEAEAPWAAYKKEIKRVVFSGDITYIGARAFSDYDMLETVNFGNALYEIGEAAFKSCDGLTVIYLPASFKIFREESFMSCSSLMAIHCSGKPLTFKLNSMWDTYGTIYYPADKPWSVEYIADMETAFKGRIEFLASDGTDHYIPEEETEPVTEAPTEELTQPHTEAPTEEPTEAPTEMPTAAPTEPETTLVTEPVTEAAATEVPETEPAAEQQPESRSWIGMVIFGAAAVFLLLGMVIVRAAARKGKYSRGRRKR